MEKTLTELHGMLKNAKQSIKKTTPVLVVQKAKGVKGKSKAKSKNKVGPYTKGKGCFHCNEAGHWKRNCPLYLEEIKKNGSKASTFMYLCYRNQPFYFYIIGLGYWMWFSHLCKCAGATK